MEVAVDVIVVDLDQNPPRYEEERRVFKPEYILDLCGSKLRLDTSPEGEDVVDNRVESRTITAAHSSVLDFLSSRSFQIGSERPTRFTKSRVNAVMAEICLIYLQLFLENEDWTDENRKKHPLIWLCASFWHISYRESFVEPQEEIDTTCLNTQILALLTSREIF